MPSLLRHTALAVVLTVAFVGVSAILSSGVGNASGVSGSASTSGLPTWAEQATYLPTPTTLTDVTCPSPSNCTAVGEGGSTSAIVGTSDGGTTWTDETIPPQVGLSSVSCPSVADCMAVGGGDLDDILVTTDGGATWTPRTPPAGVPGGFMDVSCGSAIDCVGVTTTATARSYALVSTANGGVTWTSASVPSGLVDFSDLSCLSATRCIALAVHNEVGIGGSAIIVSNDGGATWTDDSPSSPYAFDSISCPTSSMCMVTAALPLGGAVILITTDGGATWAPLSLPSGIGSVSEVSCGTASQCTALGLATVTTAPTFLTTTDGGATWTTQAQPADGIAIRALACSGAFCTAVGTVDAEVGIITRSSAGGTWTVAPHPQGVEPIGGISCPSPSTCFSAAGASVLATENSGATWTSQTIPGGGGGLAVISCATTSDCVALGLYAYLGEVTATPSSGLAVVTTDGGSTWQSGTLPSGIGQIRAVSCASTAKCAAVGTTTSGSPLILVTTDGGHSWRLGTVPPATLALYGVSCTSDATCVAVGGSTDAETDVYAGVILVSADAGSTWSSKPVPPGNIGLSGVSCSTADDCVAVGSEMVNDVSPTTGAIIATTDGGSTWSPEPSPTGVGQLIAASCPTPAGCVAVGETDSDVGVILATTTGAPGWTVSAVFGSGDVVRDVSCFALSTCEAISSANGSSIIWGPAHEALSVSKVSPASGPTAGGTSVTITGTGFSGATEVLFGTTEAASWAVVNDTTIVAVSPLEAAGLRNIAVRTPTGQSPTSSADWFTYVAPPVRPVVTAVTPRSGPSSGGTVISVTGTNLKATGTTTVYVGTVVATHVTVTSTTHLTALAPPETAGLRNVFVKTSGGTSAASSADWFTYVVHPPVAHQTSPTPTRS